MKRISFLFVLLLIPAFVSAKTVTCTSNSKYYIGHDVYENTSIECSEGSVEVFAVGKGELSGENYLVGGTTEAIALEGESYWMDIVWTGTADAETDTLVVDGEDQSAMILACDTGCHLHTKTAVSEPAPEEPGNNNGTGNNEPGNTEYTILAGPNQTYILGSNEAVVIEASGELDNLMAIEIDNGNVIDQSNYELASPGTKLTLKTHFLENSSLGEHTITIKYNDGEVETKLTIANASNDDPTNNDDTNGTNEGTNNTNNQNNTNNPQTADSIVFYVSMLGLSLIGLLSAGIYAKKKMFNK